MCRKSTKARRVDVARRVTGVTILAKLLTPASTYVVTALRVQETQAQKRMGVKTELRVRRTFDEAANRSSWLLPQTHLWDGDRDLASLTACNVHMPAILSSKLLLLAHILALPESGRSNTFVGDLYRAINEADKEDQNANRLLRLQSKACGLKCA
ncbi:hypothetical protein BC629DRAFT_1445162 [Irpex lacteus]|nr:hypothetical protein BC629DRAFT_1445162 [Irpex lacteus]